MSIESDISRARKKPVPDDKMREMLLKLRKGASAWLTFGKIVQVLDRLGWEISPIEGWTAKHYPYEDREHLMTMSVFREAELGGLERERSRLKSLERSSLPGAPRSIGEIVIMDVGPIKSGGSGSHYFYWREWVGTGGVEIRTPRGDEEGFLPGHMAVRDNRNDRLLITDGPIYDLWRWAIKVGVVDDINEALDMEEHVPAAERTRENTGTCAVCFGNYKLEGGRAVLHGYRRPGYGHVTGSCFAVGYEPLEVSATATSKYLVFLEGGIRKEKERLADLQSGKMELLLERPMPGGARTISPDHPSYRRYLDNMVREQIRMIESLEEEAALYAKVIAAWHPRSMPREGEAQRGHGFFLK